MHPARARLQVGSVLAATAELQPNHNHQHGHHRHGDHQHGDHRHGHHRHDRYPLANIYNWHHRHHRQQLALEANRST